MDIEGTVIQYLGRQEGTSKAGNHWKKDEYVMETPGTYPKKVKFTIFGDKCDTIKCEPGKSYNFSVDIESREYNERWYTDVNVYAVRAIETGGQPEGGDQYTVPPAAPAAPADDPFGVPTDNNADDLPF